MNHKTNVYFLLILKLNKYLGQIFYYICNTMKEILNIAQLKTQVVTVLKTIFNMENQAMSAAWIKVQKPKSPFDHLRRK